MAGQPVEQGLHGLAHDVEAVGAGELAPVSLDLGDPVPRVVERPWGQEPAGQMRRRGSRPSST
jgi:hypothetical protein